MLDIKQTNLKRRCNCHIFEICSNFNLDKIAQKTNDNGIIQVFQGDISSKEFLDICFKIRQLASYTDCLFIIQDRLDIAKIADSDGIYIDSNSINYDYAKSFLSENKIIGSDLTYCNYSDYVITDKEIENKITYILNSNTAHYKAIKEV